jgi:hypothetical protein
MYIETDRTIAKQKLHGTQKHEPLEQNHTLVNGWVSVISAGWLSLSLSNAENLLL